MKHKAFLKIYKIFMKHSLGAVCSQSPPCTLEIKLSLCTPKYFLISLRNIKDTQYTQGNYKRNTQKILKAYITNYLKSQIKEAQSIPNCSF